MLALKLLMVPFFLAVISIIAKRYGPSMAGWVAGMPVIVGPILFLLALEHGTVFAGGAALFTLTSVFTVIAFGLGYAWTARRSNWGAALAVGLVAWLAAAMLVAANPLPLFGAVMLVLALLVIGPRLYPKINSASADAPSALPPGELLLRMAIGAALTYGVTTFAQTVGQVWSGIAALAPVLTPVLAVFIHARSGGAAAIALLRSLVSGLSSLAAFCFVVAWQLATLGIAKTFLLAVVAALVMQTATFYWRRQSAQKIRPANS